MVASRRKDRKLILELLYEIDITGRPLKEILESKKEAGIEIALSEFAVKIINGVLQSRPFLDEIIERYSEDWTVTRMPYIDRNILRIAVFELLFCKDIPPAVSINEAVELAKVYSTDEARRFINGVLGRIASDVEKIKQEVKAI